MAYSQTTELIEQVKLYVSVGRYEAAESSLRATINQDTPQNLKLTDAERARCHHMLGYVYHQQSQFDRANEQYSLALKADPTHVESLLCWLVVLCDLGDYHKAAKMMGEVDMQIDKGHGLSYQTLSRLAHLHESAGDHYNQCGLHHRALTEYQSADQLSVQSPGIKMKVAESFMELGSYQRAKKELTDLLRHEECYHRSLCLLGLIAYEEGDYVSCDSYWQQLKSKTSVPSKSDQPLVDAYKDVVRYLRPLPTHSPHP